MGNNMTHADYIENQDEDLNFLIESLQTKRKPRKNIFDWRDELINKGKIKTCQEITSSSPVFNTCRQEALRGSFCYYHSKIHRGLIAPGMLTQTYRAIH